MKGKLAPFWSTPGVKEEKRDRKPLGPGLRSEAKRGVGNQGGSEGDEQGRGERKGRRGSTQGWVVGCGDRNCMTYGPAK